MQIRKKSEQYVQKKIDHLSHTVFITHSSSLENELMDSDDKVQPFFCTYCERAAVWAAFRERSYEGIAHQLVMSKADVRRYNKKCTYAS